LALFKQFFLAIDTKVEVEHIRPGVVLVRFHLDIQILCNVCRVAVGKCDGSVLLFVGKLEVGKFDIFIEFLIWVELLNLIGRLLERDHSIRFAQGRRTCVIFAAVNSCTKFDIILLEES
jgi:hypothetical protein